MTETATAANLHFAGGKMEAIVLAGGLGTRLRDVIGEIPKCMATVAGKPFLHYIFQYLSDHEISHVVLSLGFKSEVVMHWLKNEARPFTIDWVIEERPLGTGGGIRLAMMQCSGENVFVLNGDTMFQANLRDMYHAHLRQDAETTIALKTMSDFDRYGTVSTEPKADSPDKLILSFQEKAPKKKGDINGGIYLVSRKRFMKRPFPPQFSFEREYLEQFVSDGTFYGYPSDAYFIDIGVPQDYERAQLDFQTLFPA